LVAGLQGRNGVVDGCSVIGGTVARRAIGSDVDCRRRRSVPDSATVVGELVALLTTVTVPTKLPAAVGVKATFKVSD